MRPHRHRVAAAAIMSMGLSLLDMSGPLMVAVLIDVIVARGRYELLLPVMVLFLAIPVVSGLLRMVNGFIVELLGQRLVFDIRLDLYRRVHRLSCKFMNSTSTGKLMERLRGDVNQLQLLLTEQTLSLAVQLVTGLLTVVVMFVLSPPLTMMILLAVLLYVGNYKWFVRRIRKVQRRHRYKMDTLSSIAQERISATVAVKTFGAERRESRHFVRRNFVAQRVMHRYRMLNNIYGTASSLIGSSTQLMVLLVGTYLAVQGQLTYGTVTAMAALSMRLIDPAIQMAELSNVVQQAKVSLDRIFELMQADPDTIDRSGSRLPCLRGEVAFQGLRFYYNPDEPILQYLNFRVEPGQTVALVGQTGCGKTTITRLLYRYYEAQEGRLEIDGQDIRQLDVRWYRKHLAMVPQEPIVFDTTIAENIAYGRPAASLEQIERAAAAAELTPLVDSLTDGLGTRIGDRGIKLSVGEKQRLCIARAILAEPTILILDEATSSLDPQAEAFVQIALKRLMANRTCFVIAHRLSTIIEADLIVVLEQGRVLEMGTHAQLVNRSQGHYRHLYETQTAHQRLLEVAS